MWLIDASEVIRSAHNIGKRPSELIVVHGLNSLPDEMNTNVGTLSEAKNRAKLSYSRQLRGYVAYAQGNMLQVELYVRETSGFNGSVEATRLTEPLNRAICSGAIVIKAIPTTVAPPNFSK
ncbi:hypothetical protein G8764_01275 [Pseudomaricurvus alcaniphilus]|nr:hypothetical protein [Pseudomaricurvus alcaniphilus]